jgi:phage tail sheath protein FI
MLRILLLITALLFTLPSFAVISISMGIAGFIDNTLQGPVNRPIEIRSLNQFERTFMGSDLKLYKDSRAYLQVKQFFLNGGEMLFFNRVLGDDYLGGLEALSTNVLIRNLVIPGLNTLTEPKANMIRQKVFEFVHEKNMMLIMDSPAELSFNEVLVWREHFLEIEESSRRHVAVYFNRIQVDGVWIGVSGSMAGIFAKTETWLAPANISIDGASKLEINIGDNQQMELTAPASGLSINAIRSFPGRGILVWGARTLDGNSLDWRYISANRLQIQLQESIALAISNYRYAPNVASTWVGVKSEISHYLISLWQLGALAGASAQDAFNVEVGLGSTMSPEDIVNKVLRVQLTVALSALNEFITMTFEQEMK